jgi:diadenosine tetraphosphate (Ap4A) HIT family hydrolase
MRRPWMQPRWRARRESNAMSKAFANARTAIHRIVERCRSGDYPAAVAKLPSGWVIMGECQVLAGYCLLLPDPVVDHLNALSGAARARFLADMALTGDAVLACTGAMRVNYAVFGNVEPALHAHVFPRRAKRTRRDAHRPALGARLERRPQLTRMPSTVS